MNLLRALAAMAAAVLLAPGLSRATSVIPPTLDELVERADAVVRARVTGTRCEWWGEGDERHIVTVVSLAVNETLVGAHRSTLQLEFLGGEIDGQRLIVTGQTRFLPGGEDILFVSRERSALTPLVRMMYGRYLVGRSDEGRRFVARDNGVPLASTDEIATELASRPPGTVFAQIAAGRTVSPDDFADAVRASATRLGRTDVSTVPGGASR
ncbi:MAG: hypothetical protein IAE82_05725 [Opitutaceae bacterium]|nr:hypothetical protein [Opitutaceae bacterium]